MYNDQCSILAPTHLSRQCALRGSYDPAERVRAVACTPRGDLRLPIFCDERWRRGSSAGGLHWPMRDSGEQNPFANVPPESAPIAFHEKIAATTQARTAQRRAGLLPRKRLLGVYRALFAQTRLLLWQWLPALPVSKTSGKKHDLNPRVCISSTE